MPARRTKSWILLSGAFLLWSNEYETNYSFIELDGRGRDADIKGSAGLAQPNHDDAANLEAEADSDTTSFAAQGSADTGHNSK